MHVIIINGSPRVLKFSNTDKIIQSFGKGLQESGATYELYSLSNRKEWDTAREAFISYEQIIFALPLYVNFLSRCQPSVSTQHRCRLSCMAASTKGISCAFASDSYSRFLSNSVAHTAVALPREAVS